MHAHASAWRHVAGLGILLLSTAACGTDDRQDASDSTAGSVSAAPADSAPMDAVPATPASADDDMQQVLDQLAVLGPKPIETLTAAEARQQPTPTDAVMAILKQENKPTAPTALVPGVTSADRTIPGAEGQIPARIYTPEGAGPFPVVVYYHGGGWVIADKDVYDGGARGLAKAANAVVVSVDYRRAPEHKFPAAHDDALAAYEWTLKNAASINGDPQRVALAGESAGGNLAVATAIAARDAKSQQPAAVIAVYPVTQTDTTTPSYVTYAAAKPLSRPMMGWFIQQTVRSDADLMDPRLNLVAADLHGLPPVTIINAEIDPLLSDGLMLARALRDAGVSVEQKTYDGVTHEFFGMAAVLDEAKDAQQLAGDRLKAAFGG